MNPAASDLKHGHGHASLPRTRGYHRCCAGRRVGRRRGGRLGPRRRPDSSAGGACARAGRARRAGDEGPAHPSPFTDYTTERPGKRVKIVAADLPAPGATRSVDNGPRVVKRPKDAWPQAPAGFNVQLYADGLSKPRLIRMAPNGDVFVVESD